MVAVGMTLLRLDEEVGATQRLRTFQLPQCLASGGVPKIAVRLADCSSERDSAIGLINRKYASRGYGGEHQLPSSGYSTTFTVSSSGALIGTLSLTVDCPAGLASDATFRDELSDFRQGGASICELTKFAFDGSHVSMRLLASLFHTILIYGTNNYNCTDLFIEVGSRHRRFYETMLGFKQVGNMRINKSVGVQSHLMWIEISDVRRKIDKYRRGKIATSSSHSLYPFFFTEKEETEIRMRLLGCMRHNHGYYAGLMAAQ